MKRDVIFSPSFGNRPDLLIGRNNEIKAFIDGLDERVGSRERSTLFIGQRGQGKTVLLLELSEQAKEKDFVVVGPITVSGNMLDRIIEKLQSEGEKYIKKRNIGKIKGGTLGAFGFSVGLQFDQEVEKKSFAYKLEKLIDALETQGKGVLLLIDEIQSKTPELRELVITYQQLIGDNKNIAIGMAGLPGAISSVLNDKVLTFFNRAKKIELGPIKSSDIYAYYINAFAKMGIRITADQIKHAVEETKGSPYMMQLIGHMITISADDEGLISEIAFDNAIELSKEDYINDICKTAVQPLSDVDISFIKAMTKDDEVCKMRDIASRMDVTSDYADKYKNRLLDAGIIAQERRGEVFFAVPYMKDYLTKYY